LAYESYEFKVRLQYFIFYFSNYNYNTIDLINAEKPSVKLSDVVGLDDAKNKLIECAVIPLKYPNCFLKFKKECHKILLYGLAGTGKSFLTQAIINECENCNTFYVNSSQLASKFKNYDSRAIKFIFGCANAAQPSLIVFDDMESLFKTDHFKLANSNYSSILNELLNQMDGEIFLLVFSFFFLYFSFIGNNYK
jgi:SpoVK/Ycf46/Vps4 family AAA+-type ATPase